jgi:hypothetical protein
MWHFSIPVVAKATGLDAKLDIISPSNIEI